MSTTRFKYMVLTSYIRDEATMNHQGARIAQHLAEMDPPSIVSFRWEALRVSPWLPRLPSRTSCSRSSRATTTQPLSPSES